MIYVAYLGSRARALLARAFRTTESGEPRGIEAEHSADLPSAQGSDQAIKAGPFDGAARGAAKIVVNHFDIGKPASPCDFNQIVLAPLAFQAQLNLLLRRLPDIDDGLAL